MPNVYDILRLANRTLVAEEVTRRGYEVSPETMSRWLRKRSGVPAVVEHIIFDLFGTGQALDQRPAWVDEAMVDMVGQVTAFLSAAVPPEQLELAARRLQEFREARQRRAGEASAPPPPRPDTAPANGPR